MPKLYLSKNVNQCGNTTVKRRPGKPDSGLISEIGGTFWIQNKQRYSLIYSGGSVTVSSCSRKGSKCSKSVLKLRVIIIFIQNA